MAKLRGFIVCTTVNLKLCSKIFFSTRTKAQNYILKKYKEYNENDNYYIRFVNYKNWGKYKKIENEKCIESFTAETKNDVLYVELVII